MSNWFKIGLPVLIAVLLVVASVAVTLAMTQPFTPKQTVATAYNTTGAGQQLPAQTGLCPNCPDYQAGNSVATAPKTGTGAYCGNRGGCCQGRGFNNSD